MEPLGVWEILIDGRRVRLAPNRDLGQVPNGRRYVVRDVTSELMSDDPEGPDGVLYSAEFLDLPDAADRDRLFAAVEAFRTTDAGGALVQVHGAGSVVGRPAAVVLVTELWVESLADRLARDRSLPDREVDELYLPVVMGLFRLHERGLAHAGVCPAAVARTEQGWRLSVGRPTRDAAGQPEADVADFGRLCEAVLGSPRRPPPQWATLIARCTDRSPARRWPTARLLFGTNAPPAVANLTAEPLGDAALSYRVSWPPPAAGRFALYDWTAAHRPPPAGEVQSWARLAPQLGPPVPLSAGATEVTVPVNGDGRTLVGVTVYDDAGVAIVGGSGRLTRVRDVQGLTMTAYRGRLTFRWQWPPGVTTAAVAVRGGRFPVAPDDAVGRGECLISQYEASGSFSLALPAGLTDGVYATVFAASGTPGRLTYSPGLGAGSRAALPHAPTAVQYEVRKSGGRTELVLTPSAACTLPALVLVGGSKLPLAATDGTVLCDVPAGKTASPTSPMVVPFARPPALAGGVARLFCHDRADYAWLELIPVPLTNPTL